MADPSNPAGTSQDRQPAPAVVPLGTRLPAAANVPMPGGPPAEPEGRKRSEIAQGVVFTGSAVLHGPCTVKGRVVGSLKLAEGTKAAVVVAESGDVKGDIAASQISVHGRTDGLLDATGGSVLLHESASVSGHVRYLKIQVNGTDLNATLERSPPNAPGVQPAAAAAARPVTDPMPELKFPAGALPGAPGGPKA